MHNKIDRIDERKIIGVICLIGAAFLGGLGTCLSDLWCEIGLTVFSIVFSAIASWLFSTVYFEKRNKVNERRVAKSIDNMCKALIESLDSDIEYYAAHDFQSRLYSYRNQIIAIKDTTYGIGIDYIDMELYEEYEEKQKQIGEHLKQTLKDTSI